MSAEVTVWKQRRSDAKRNMSFVSAEVCLCCTRVQGRRISASFQRWRRITWQSASRQGLLPVPTGLSQRDVVLRHFMQMSGQRWREQDIGFFWDFAKGTL